MQREFFEPGSVLLKCTIERLDWNHRFLSGPFWRFYWNRTGTSTVSLGDDDYFLNPATMMLIPPNTTYRKNSDDISQTSKGFQPIAPELTLPQSP